MPPTFADWLLQQMARRGIRSGRRLALETGLDEALLLDCAIGRRVPGAADVDVLARFFGVSPTEAQQLRERGEQATATRSRR